MRKYLKWIYILGLLTLGLVLQVQSEANENDTPKNKEDPSITHEQGGENIGNIKTLDDTAPEDAKNDDDDPKDAAGNADPGDTKEAGDGKGKNPEVKTDAPEVRTTSTATDRPAPVPTTSPAQPTASPTTPPSGPPSFTVTSSKGQPCIKAAFNLKMAIAYNIVTQNNKSDSRVTYLEVPQGASTNGSKCGTKKDGAKLQLSWGDQHYILIMSFTQTTAVTYVTKIQFNYDTKDQAVFQDAQKDNHWSVSTGQNATLFSAKSNSTYKCDSAQNLVFTGKNDIVTATVKNIQIQAEALPASGAFSTDVTVCPADHKDTPNKANDIVPVVIAAFIAAAALLVIIGYCISRNRPHSGYSHMQS
ncbi:unnamed protein product [Owenia fusiformis]|uniref:Lysosome-associated membrane glycoprotein 5 n=1 Tax=Owenia fusiformis TaxID=6347 RepID=A0A8J1ULM3_OWEFU|nr:unnamed protein product [Owenia fusiformis]CAH1793284.1 unnamed protein product [Owenia fusiformis]